MIHQKSTKEIFKHTNSNGEHCLIIAAEENHIEALQHILNRGFDVNKVGKNQPSAIDVAWSRGHHEVVLLLLQHNSKFPTGFVAEKASLEVRDFASLMNDFHTFVKHEQSENIQIVINANQNLSYFYNSENESALSAAASLKNLNIYEMLMQNNITLGSHESLYVIIEKMEQRLQLIRRRKLRKINAQFANSATPNTILTLLANSFIAPGVENRHKKIHCLIKAYSQLYEILQISVVMDLVAAKKNFKINFDFNRDSVDFMVPSEDENTDGSFFLTGHIYIGARNLLSAETASKTMGVIAHELCHFSMNLVFKNWAKPYVKNNSKVFEEVSILCNKNRKREEIVEVVYTSYARSMHHAEIIVRVPHMLALYHEQTDIIAQRRGDFPELFNHYEHDTMPAMREALPSIREENMTEEEKKIRILSRRIKALYAGLILSIGFSIVGCLIYYFFFLPMNWGNMSDVNKNKIKNANVNYSEVGVQFQELFNETNQEFVYHYITNDQIRNAIDGNFHPLTKFVEDHRHDIFLSFTNLSINLKSKFLNTKIYFQDCEITIEGIFDSNLTALNDFDSDQIKSFLSKNISHIQSKLDHVKAKFFIEREFETVEKSPKSLGNTSAIINVVNDQKLFLLSDISGEGKSRIFEELAVNLKFLSPHKWVQFIDLKTHSNSFKDLNFSVIEEVGEFLAVRVLQLTGINRTTFMHTFRTNNTILLFDEMSEISHVHGDFILNLVVAVHNFTNNSQLISTRPPIAKTIESKLSITAHKMKPLNANLRLKFLIGFIVLEFDENKTPESFLEYLMSTDDLKGFNSSNFKIDEKTVNAIKRGEMSLEKIEDLKGKTRLVNNPLLIYMIACISTGKEGFIVTENTTLFDIIRKFAEIKTVLVGRLDNKLIKENSVALASEGFNQPHQHYAVPLILKEIPSYNMNRTAVTLTVRSRIKFEVISLYGIVAMVQGTDEKKFIHKAFAEYFTAVYIVDNVNDNVLLYYAIQFKAEFELLKDFMHDYIKTDPTLISEELKSFTDNMNEKIIELRELEIGENILEFFMFVEFLQAPDLKFKDAVKIGCEKLTQNDVKNLNKNWEKFKGILGVDAFENILMTSSDNRTFFHEFMLVDENLLLDFLDKSLATLEEENMKNILERTDESGRNLAMLISRDISNVIILREFLEFHENLFGYKFENFLSTKSHDSLYIFHHAIFNLKSPKAFNVSLESYERILSEDTIGDMLLEMPNLLTMMMHNASSVACEDFRDYLELIFENDRSQVDNLTNYRDDKNRTFFMPPNEIVNLPEGVDKITKLENYGNKCKIFEELIMFSFYNNASYLGQIECLKNIEVITCDLDIF